MGKTKAIGVGCIQIRSIFFSGLSLLVLLSGFEAKAGCNERDSLECFFSLRDNTLPKAQKETWRKECKKNPSKEGCKMVLLDMQIDGEFNQKDLPGFEIQILTGYMKAAENKGCWGTYHSSSFIKLACACYFGKEAQQVLDEIHAKVESLSLDERKFKDACFSHYKVPGFKEKAFEEPCPVDGAPAVSEGTLEVTRKGGVLSRVKEAWAERKNNKKKEDQDSEPQVFMSNPAYKEEGIKGSTPPLSAAEEERLQSEALARATAKGATAKKGKFKLGEKIREVAKAAREKVRKALPSRRRGEDPPADLAWNNGTHTNPLFVEPGHKGNMPDTVTKNEPQKGVLRVPSDFKRPPESQLDKAIEAAEKSKNAGKPVLKRADSAVISDEQLEELNHGLRTNRDRVSLAKIKAARRRAAEENLSAVPSIEEARKKVEARETAKKEALAKGRADEEAEYSTKLAEQKKALEIPSDLLNTEKKLTEAITRAQRLKALEKKRGGLEEERRTAELGRLQNRLENLRNSPKENLEKPSPMSLDEIKKLTPTEAVSVLRREMPVRSPNEEQELKAYVEKVRSYLKDGQKRGNLNPIPQRELQDLITQAQSRGQALYDQKNGNQDDGKAKE